MMKKLTFIFAFQLLFSIACFANDDELIQAWNNQALELLKTGNISSPVNKSALYYLARIEKVSPHHANAKKLRSQIISAYQTLSEKNSNSNDKKLLKLISSDLQKYSESARLDESTSSSRVQRFLKLNYPSVKTEKLAALESDFSLYKTTIDESTDARANELADNTNTSAQDAYVNESSLVDVEEQEKVITQPSPKVIAWEKKAEQRITQAKLSLPLNDSALHYLALIEKESLDSEVTNALREKIAKRYIGLGSYAISNNQNKKGNKWLSIGKHIQNFDVNSGFSNTLESVNAFNRGEIIVKKVSNHTSDNNRLLSISEQKPQAKLLSQTLDVSVDNSDWINPFDKKRKKSQKKKVELNINEDIKPGDNKIVTQKQSSTSQELVNKSETYALSSSEENKIQTLYEQAQIDISSNRLTRPAHRNAYKKLLAIENIQNTHPTATQLRNDIYNAYVDLIRTAISAGLNEKATLWLDSADNILPNQNDTLQLRQQLND